MGLPTKSASEIIEAGVANVSETDNPTAMVAIVGIAALSVVAITGMFVFSERKISAKADEFETAGFKVKGFGFGIGDKA